MANTIKVRNKASGEIITLRRKDTDTLQSPNILPEVAQATGSVVGGAIGGIPGSAVGAGVGRVVGEVGEQAGATFSPVSGFIAPQSMDSQVANIQNLMGGLTGGAGEFVSSDREAAIQTIKNSALSGGADLAFGVGGATIGKIASFVSKGVGRGLFGKEVADRLLARPQQVFGKLRGGFEDTAMKAKNFFGNLSNKVGGEVEKAVLANPKNLRSMDDVIQNIASNTENGAVVNFLDIPKNQKTKISNILQEISSIKGKNVNAEKVWELRKGVDKIIKKMSSVSEGRKLLYGVRGELANKLKTFDGEISKNFDNFRFVQEAEENIGRFLKGVKTTEGKVISPKLEQFTKTLLKSDKTETIKLLEEVSGMAPVEQRIAEEILDIAASEGIARDIGGGVLSRVALQTLGGSQNIAKFLTLPSSQKASILAQIQKATVPAIFTGALTREQ